MSRVVHKFPLKLQDAQVLSIPGDTFQPLCVQYQGDQLCLWAMVDAQPALNVVTQPRVFIAGTGNPIPNAVIGDDWVDTVHRDGYVWHVFVL